jgi:hypothetical protein
MTNLALYQLSGQLQQVAQQLADDGLDEQTIKDTLEAISGDFEDKAKAIVQMSRNFSALADSIKEAEAEMAARRKRLEARVASMKAYVLREMQAVGIERIDCPLFAVSIRKNPPSVDVFDPAQVPADYWIEPPPPPKTISKELIKKAIKDGFDVPGAKLSQGVRLNVE